MNHESNRVSGSLLGMAFGDALAAETEFLSVAEIVRRFGPNGPAVSSGDSDSIACLTGAFAGAYHGLDAWPSEWVTRIEYRERLVKVGAAWDWK